MKRTIFLASVMAPILVTTSGCASLHKAMGFEKQPPDEYTVVENAPLTMPPDFGLRPPSSTSARPADASPQDQARETVFTTGNVVSSTEGVDTGGGLTAGEAALLSGAGATQASPGIRDQIDQESVAKQNASDTLIHRILYHGIKKQTDDTLDPQKESDRIQSEAASGKPITSGETPAVQRTSHSVFDAL